MSQAYWNSMPVAGVIVNDALSIQAVNQAAELFLNASERKLIGRALSHRLQAEADLEPMISRVYRDQSSVSVKRTMVTVAGHAPAVCDIQIAPVTDKPGEVLLLLLPRPGDGRLEQGHGLRNSVRSAIGMSEMLAHEIKNPLAGITGAAQLLAMGLDESNQEMTDLIVSESRRIVALLEQVEQFGNLQPPACKPTNVHDVLEQARRSAELGFAGKSNLHTDYDPSLPLTYVDSDQMIQVVSNLLRNAVEAIGPGGGNLTIRTFFDRGLRRRDSQGNSKRLPIQVEIIDDGPGLPPDLAADIFDPFVSGRENGTGLGLALVSKIVSDHGAWIGVTSKPGRTVFRLSLPLAQPDEPPQKETS